MLTAYLSFYGRREVVILVHKMVEYNTGRRNVGVKYMKKIGERILYEGRWIVLKELHLEGKEGQDIRWETVHRVQETAGLIVVAQLKPSDRIVFIRQYRPVLNNHIIGFPAGIADRPDLKAEALRELLEETGYTGVVTAISPELRSNPAVFSDRAYVVRVEIDEEDERNLNPQQHLEASEEIEVMLVPLEQARAFLLHRHEAGDEIGIGPWFVFGLR